MRTGRRAAAPASRLWLEIVASVLDLPLERTESEEGSAFGAALLGGVAGGVFADVSDAVARCVRVGDVRSSPSRRCAEAYAELHARFRALYPALRPFGSRRRDPTPDASPAVARGRGSRA